MKIRNITKSEKISNIVSYMQRLTMRRAFL